MQHILFFAVFKYLKYGMINTHTHTVRHNCMIDSSISYLACFYRLSMPIAKVIRKDPEGSKLTVMTNAHLGSP